MKKDYREYIKSPEWRLRSRLYRNAHPKCEICGCDEKFKLHTHHVSYEHLGSESDKDLMTLCKDCHDELEFVKDFNPHTPVLHYFYTRLDNVCLWSKVERALGIYAPIWNMMLDKLLDTYEVEVRKYCESRYEELRDYAYEEQSYAKDLDVKKLRKSEIDYESEFRMPLERLRRAIGSGLTVLTFERIIDGLNGKDNRVTCIADSGDDLADYYIMTEMEDDVPSDFEIEYSAFRMIRYLLEIIDCYHDRYPNLVHNAKIIAYILLRGFPDNLDEYLYEEEE